MAIKSRLFLPRLSEAVSRKADDVLASEAKGLGWFKTRAGPEGHVVEGVCSFRKLGVVFMPTPQVRLSKRISDVVGIGGNLAIGALSGFSGFSDLREVFGIDLPTLNINLGNRSAGEWWRDSVGHEAHFVFCWADIVAIAYEPPVLAGQERVLFGIQTEYGDETVYSIAGIPEKDGLGWIQSRINNDLEVAIARVCQNRQREILRDRAVAQGTTLEALGDIDLTEADERLGGGGWQEAHEWFDALSEPEGEALVAEWLAPVGDAYHVAVETYGGTPASWFPPKQTAAAG